MNHDHTFVVGDIHGCFDELMLLLKKAHYNPSQHRLILVGDLINKGPYSLKTLEWAYQNNIESVLGNHELKFIQWIERDLPLPPSFHQIKEEMGDQIEKWIQYLKSWPKFIEENDFLVVHAGLKPGQHPSHSPVEILVHIRHWDEKKGVMCNQQTGRPWHEYYQSDKLVIYGHWARQGLLKKKNSIGLDSGCVYGKVLTGVFLPSQTIVQVPSSQSLVFG